VKDEEDAQTELAAIRASLEAAGIDATDLGRFATGEYPDTIAPTRFDFAAAVPVFLAWLPKVQTKVAKEVVVRSLTDRAARPHAARPLIEAFERESDPMVQWTIGNALDTVADDSVWPDLMRIAAEKKFGKGRQMVVYRLGRGPKRADVAELLYGLCEDEDVPLHAMTGLQRQVGHQKARQRIEALLSHPSAAVRKAAAIQMRKIKAAERRAAKAAV
jgi:hypothetical protein